MNKEHTNVFLLIFKYYLIFKKDPRNESKQVHQNLSESCKFDPDGTRGPIWPVDTVLESWCGGHHACIKKFVDLTTSKSDLLFGCSIFQVPSSSIFQVSNIDRKVLSHRHPDIDIDVATSTKIEA